MTPIYDQLVAETGSDPLYLRDLIDYYRRRAELLIGPMWRAP